MEIYYCRISAGKPQWNYTPPGIWFRLYNLRSFCKHALLPTLPVSSFAILPISSHIHTCVTSFNRSCSHFRGSNSVYLLGVVIFFSPRYFLFILQVSIQMPVHQRSCPRKQINFSCWAPTFETFRIPPE